MYLISFSHAGPRSYQEDRVTFFSRQLINDDMPVINSEYLAVFDGLGGHPHGDLAAQEAMEMFETVNSLDQVEPMLASINKKLKKYRDERATTAVTAVITNNKATIHWAGDSRCYVLRNTELLQLTKDQGKGHILYNALGIAGELVAEKIEFDLESGDLLMLSTDGVHDYITEDSLKEHLVSIRDHWVKAKFYNLESFIKHLIGSTRDNFTFVVGIVE